jgi:hypothetical protein
MEFSFFLIQTELSWLKEVPCRTAIETKLLNHELLADRQFFIQRPLPNANKSLGFRVRRENYPQRMTENEINVGLINEQYNIQFISLFRAYPP